MNFKPNVNGENIDLSVIFETGNSFFFNLKNKITNGLYRQGVEKKNTSVHKHIQQCYDGSQQGVF
jgi:hypothetical protein